MNKIKIEKIKTIILPILKKHQVKRASLFGSLVRGDSKKNSDIDILVEFSDDKTLFNLIDLEIELEEILKRKIDLISFNSVNPLLKLSIFKNEDKIVYA